MCPDGQYGMISENGTQFCWNRTDAISERVNWELVSCRAHLNNMNKSVNTLSGSKFNPTFSICPSIHSWSSANVLAYA